jgi:2-polyprenyl-3-methyl-5-hydroxy-6-metoxy-1,4-benzoquinol methylase
MLRGGRAVLRRPFYSEFAWAYDLLIQGPTQSRCDFFQVSVSRRGVLSGSRILDAGCGTGEYAIELACRGYEVSGILALDAGE